MDDLSFSFSRTLKNGFQQLCTRRVILFIVLGQVLAALSCLTGVCSELLVRNGANIPATQTFINYFLMAVIYGSATAFGCGDEPFARVLRRRGLFYVLVALADVEANFLMVTAYQYTSIASVQILDCVTIPTVLLLSYFVFGARVGPLHIIGVLLCLTGVACLIIGDSITGKYATSKAAIINPTTSPLFSNESLVAMADDVYSNMTSTFASARDGSGSSDVSSAIIGDLLCIAGAALYGVSNVSQEYTVKRHSVIEYLGMLGICGAIIGGVQLILLESSALVAIDWTNVLGVLLPLAGFAAAMFSLSLVFAFVVRHTSATVVNLNVLTADLYALLCGILLFGSAFHVLYVAAFLLILFGVILYLVREPAISVYRADRFERFITRLERLLCIADPVNATVTVENPQNPQRDAEYADVPTQNTEGEHTLL